MELSIGQQNLGVVSMKDLLAKNEFDLPKAGQIIEGEIIGVIAESNGKNVFIKAKKGVVMACGGFENNDAMKRDCFDPVPLTFFGNPGNTGDGVKMVQKIGGATWHMGRQVSCLGFKAPGFDAGFFIEFLAPGFINVDKYGKRFVNENDIEPHDIWRVCREFENIHHYEYPRVPFWSIFDEEVRKMGPLNMSICPIQYKTNPCYV